MEIRQLTALVTVSEVGSATKAARVLRTTQSAITRHIQLLEQEIGVPLFARHRHGMVPTAEGGILVERARRALHELERAQAELRPSPDGVRGIVSLGLLESTVDLLAPALAAAVSTRHPDIDLRLFSGYSGHLQQWLDSGSVDLSLMYDLASTPSVTVTPLLEESLWAMAPVEARLLADRPLPWSDLWLQPTVMPVSGHGLRALIDQALAETGGVPRIAVHTNSMQLQKRLVEEGHGWSVLPASGIADDVTRGRFSAAPLVDPEITRSVVIAMSTGGRVPAPVAAVATEVVRVIRQLVTSGEWPTARLVDHHGPVPPHSA